MLARLCDVQSENHTHALEYYLRPLEAVALKIGIQPFAVRVSSEIDIEKSIADLGREPGNGLISMTDSYMFVHRKNIIALSAKYKIPAMHYVSIVPIHRGPDFLRH